MNSKFILGVFLVFLCGGCATQPGAPDATKAAAHPTGCCYAYPDYPWGDYYWESPRAYNPAEVWDDYYHDTGTHWQGQEGEAPDTDNPLKAALRLLF